MTEKTRSRFINDIYVNREYSWLLFDKRVLEQSQDLSNPLLGAVQIFIHIQFQSGRIFYGARREFIQREPVRRPGARQ